MRLTIQRMRDLLVGAFEGGSNYWYRIEGHETPAGTSFDDFRKGGRCQPEGDYYHWSQLIPTTRGGVLYVAAPGEFRPVALNLRALRLGADVMQEKFPRHWANVISENDDAETADVFLQCALYGDIIFG